MSDDWQFSRLDTDAATLVLGVFRRQLPVFLYWGPALQSDTSLLDWAQLVQPPVPHGGLDCAETLSWLPEPGRGFSGWSGAEFARDRGLLVTQFLLAESTVSATRCEWRYVDDLVGIELQLLLQVEPASGVLQASTTARNLGEGDLDIAWLAAVTIPVPARCDDFLSLGGRWGGEFQELRQALPSAMWLQEARVGRTSHHAFPGVILLSRHSNETSELAVGVHLAWSGNHRVLIQRHRHGGYQLQCGELLAAGEVRLSAGETYETPVAYLVRVEDGLASLSARLHRHVRSTVLPRDTGLATRRVQFNTWEATYFDHAPVRMTALVAAAAAVGVERFVLDDGWFAGRDNDQGGLGNWSACPRKYPQGLGPLAELCNRHGMEFGLWVEPECVSADSSLYREHPDWILHLPQRQQPLGRSQYVLNLGLIAVREHLYRMLKVLLASAPIAFLKWDMNRDLTHPFGPDGRNATHLHVLGLYELLARIRAEHPQVQVETCASGGGRADYGVLKYASRVWVSDNNDPLARHRIQRGFLRFFPPEIMGSHVGDARSHVTGRITDLAVRAAAALLGQFGIEADLLAMAAAERVELAAFVARYKDLRGWLADATAATLAHPDPHLAATLAISADGRQAIAIATRLDLARDAIVAPLCLAGLAPQGQYRLWFDPLWRARTSAVKSASEWQRGATFCAPGAALAAEGIALPGMDPGTSVVIRIQRETRRDAGADSLS